MKKNLFLTISTSLFVLTIGLNSCGFLSDGDKEKKETIVISGIVTDHNNYPLSGVEVIIDNEKYTTSEMGTFLFDKFASKKGETLIIEFVKDGFFHSSSSIEETQDVNQLQVSLMKKGYAPGFLSTNIQFSNNTGTTVNLADGSQVAIQGGSVKTNSGNTNISVASISPNDYMFSSLIPGQNLKAEYEGENYHLMAYGVYFIELDDNGKIVELNKPAYIKTTIPDADVEYMPDELEIWSYNEKTAVWQFEGFAQKEGNYYIAEATHFSTWLIGMSTNQTAMVKGRVIDRSGRGINGQIVRVSQTSAVTDNKGNYKVEVPAAQEFIVGMKYKGFEIKLDGGPLSANEVYELDISVPPMTIVTGEIKNCEDELTGGQATLNWGEPDFSTQFAKNGKFELSIPSAVKSATLSIQVGDSVVKHQISNPNKLSEIDAEEFIMCVESDDPKEEKDEEIEEEVEEEVEEKKPVVKPKPVNIVGKWKFYYRSDGESKVNYHHITIYRNGEYDERYQPKGDTYIGGSPGTWKRNGDIVTLTSKGGYPTSYTIVDRELQRTSDDGTIIRFKK